MRIESDKLSKAQRYFLMVSCIIPRPIAWIGTVNEDGSNNLAPFSFFNGVTGTPPMVSLGFGPARDKAEKDTLRNIKRLGELTISIPPADLVEEVEATGEELPYGEDEFAVAGLTPVAGEMVSASWVKEAGVAFECGVYQIIPIKGGGSTLVLAEIKLFHIRDDLVDGRSCVDADRFGGLARMGGGRYATLSRVFKAKGKG